MLSYMFSRFRGGYTNVNDNYVVTHLQEIFYTLYIVYLLWLFKISRSISVFYFLSVYISVYFHFSFYPTVQCISYSPIRSLFISHSTLTLFISHSTQTLFISHSTLTLFISHSTLTLFFSHATLTLLISHSTLNALFFILNYQKLLMNLPFIKNHCYKNAYDYYYRQEYKGYN